MKKMIPIYLYILTAIVCAFAGFATAALISANKHEEQLQAKQIEIDQEKHRSLLIERQAEELREANQEAFELAAERHNKYIKLKENYELLEDVVLRLKTASEKDKLLKERIPYGMTNTIRYMDYRKITDKNSIQYKLQQNCRTENGIRYYDKYICVALGSAYGQDIGDTWRVTLECGTEFDIILAEFKDDGKTDFFGHPDHNYDEQDCINILEFVVDEEKMSVVAKQAGTYTALGYYGGLYGRGGNVAKMNYTGRVWE